MTSFIATDETRLPVASARLNHWIMRLREYFRDQEELNRLIVGQETSPRQFAWAISDAIDDFNTTPPLIGTYSISNFPSDSLLIRMAAVYVLESVAILQARNHLSYSAEGVSVSPSDKHQMLMSWAQMFRAQNERRVSRLKEAMNLELAMAGTGVPSEYLLVNGLYIQAVE